MCLPVPERAKKVDWLNLEKPSYSKTESIFQKTEGKRNLRSSRCMLLKTERAQLPQTFGRGEPT